MQIGVLVPWWVEGFQYKTALNVATQAEALGFDIVWFADHLAIPETQIGHLSGSWYEVLTLMSNIAAHVPRILLGTNVLVAPYRHPVLAAKMLATLDVVSGGRVVIGAGTGFVKEEFATLGVPFQDRGAYTTECIEVWKAVWNGGIASFNGRYFNFENMAVDPQPVQRPHPPIWIGNVGSKVLERAARVGDGWHPVALPIDDLRKGIQQLRLLWKQFNRDGQPTISYGGARSVVGHENRPEQARTLLGGGVSQVVEDVVLLREVGCDNVVFRLGTTAGGTFAEFTRQLELIAAAVLPVLST